MSTSLLCSSELQLTKGNRYFILMPHVPTNCVALYFITQSLHV